MLVCFMIYFVFLPLDELLLGFYVEGCGEVGVGGLGQEEGGEEGVGEVV